MDHSKIACGYGRSYVENSLFSETWNQLISCYVKQIFCSCYDVWLKPD